MLQKTVRIAWMLTDGGNYLGLQTILTLETACEVANTTLSVSSHIRHLADVVKHMPTGEEQDGDEADGCPDVSVLNDRKNVWRCSHQQADADNGDCSNRYPFRPIDGTPNRGMRTVR